MLKDRCNIVLIGMPSAGKTTIGKMLEEKLGKEFFDLDDMIIAKAGKAFQKSSRNLVKQDLEPLKQKLRLKQAR